MARALLFQFLIALQVIHLAVSRCEAWCSESCCELNGDTASECDGCSSDLGCHPGAECFLDCDPALISADGTCSAGAKVVSSDNEASDDNECIDIATPIQCAQWIANGLCVDRRQEMGQYCRNACGICRTADKDSESAYQKQRQFRAGTARIGGLWDQVYKRKVVQHQLCSDAELAVILNASSNQRHCEHLEDEARLPTRGFFVMRNAVAKDELERMRAFVEALPLPLRYLCGASDVQPEECMLVREEINEVFPKFFEMLEGIMEGWISSGFNTEAHLGYPLTIGGSEFISINKWGFARNSSCVFNELLDVASKHIDPACVAERCATEEEITTAAKKGNGSRAHHSDDLSIHRCWLGCAFTALIHRVPRDVTLGILEQEAQRPADAPACDVLRHEFVRGAGFEYAMGGDGFYDFGSEGAGGWGDKRLLSNLRAWLTREFAGQLPPMYQGWHDWHIDGDADSYSGRYHKVFVMVDKSTAKPSHMGLTNVKLVPADVLYAHASQATYKAMHDDKSKQSLVSHAPPTIRTENPPPCQGLYSRGYYIKPTGVRVRRIL